jgi:hypothetical protein
MEGPFQQGNEPSLYAGHQQKPSLPQDRLCPAQGCARHSRRVILKRLFSSIFHLQSAPDRGLVQLLIMTFMQRQL